MRGTGRGRAGACEPPGADEPEDDTGWRADGPLHEGNPVPANEMSHGLV